MVDISAEPTALFEAPGSRRIRPGVILACTVVLLVIIGALFGNFVAPHDPLTQGVAPRFSGPTSTTWLGTDNLGRDVWSRLILGSRDALIGPAVVALVSMLIGTLLGLAAGYFGGWVDLIISRWVDLMYALPHLLVAIVVVGVAGGDYWTATGVLSVLFIPFGTRIVRGSVIEQRVQPYAEAAEVVGLSRRRIIFAHILPNCLPLVVSMMFLVFAFALVSLAGLAFLGLGVSPDTPDWGLMVANGLGYLYQAPLMSLSGCAALIITAVSVNYLGDYVFEAWSRRSGR